MHVISDERAVAHWRALNALPGSALNYLEARFLREQPALRNALLIMMDVFGSGPDGQEILPDWESPRMREFRRMLSLAAIMNEIMSREAGRPLRRLTDEEAVMVAEESARLIEQSTGVYSLQETPNVFSTAAQRHLLTGASLAVEAMPENKPADFPRRILALRTVLESLHRACGSEPASTPRWWDAERIQFALSTPGDPLRHEALAASDAFRPELAPALLEELGWHAADPKAALEEDGSLAMHAMYILARWREESAWPVFRKLFSLPGDIGYELLGDLITEDGSVLLAMVGGNRRDELRAMVEDESLDEYCRNACLDALTCLVAWGELPRAEHVDYLRELLTTKLRATPANEHVFGGVVSAVCDLEAWELRPEVEATFQRGLVNEYFIDLAYFRKGTEGKLSTGWNHFCDCHRPVTEIATATAWLDNPPPAEPQLLSFDLEETWSPDDAPGQPYIAPPKIGRNDPCPCGSGKKYKKCCGG